MELGRKGSDFTSTGHYLWTSNDPKMYLIIYDSLSWSYVIASETILIHCQKTLVSPRAYELLIERCWIT